MFCCAASTGENPCFPDCDVSVFVNGTVVVGSGVTAAVFRGISALFEGTTGFSEPIAVVPVGIAVVFAALPAALPAGEAVAALTSALPVTFGGGMAALPAGVFWELFA
jgi:hypothetical protein